MRCCRFSENEDSDYDKSVRDKATAVKLADRLSGESKVYL